MSSACSLTSVGERERERERDRLSPPVLPGLWVHVSLHYTASLRIPAQNSIIIKPHASQGQNRGNRRNPERQRTHTERTKRERKGERGREGGKSVERERDGGARERQTERK